MSRVIAALGAVTVLFSYGCRGEKTETATPESVASTENEPEVPKTTEASLPEGWVIDERVPPVRIAFPAKPELQTVVPEGGPLAGATIPPTLVHKASERVAFTVTCSPLDVPAEAAEFLAGIRRGTIGGGKLLLEKDLEQQGAKGFRLAVEVETGDGVLVMHHQTLSNASHYCSASVIAPREPGQQAHVDAFFASMSLR